MKNNFFKNFINGKVVLAVAVGVLLFGTIFTLFRSTKKNDDTIIVGMMSGWAPFMSISPNGSYEGFDVDVAQELAQRMNKKVIIQDMGSLASCFVALEQNKIDMIFSGLSITQKRLQQFNMVYYCGDNVTSFNLLFWKEAPKDVKTLEDLKGYPNAIVVVEPGDSPEKYLDQFDFITKKQISAITDQIMDLQYGKSTAIFRSPSVARRMCLQNPQLKSISVPLPAECQIYGLGIALKKENSALTEAVQKAVQSMKDDGALKRLELQWQINESSDEL